MVMRENLFVSDTEITIELIRIGKVRREPRQADDEPGARALHAYLVMLTWNYYLRRTLPQI
jgi:hypothetical protein